MFVDRAPVLLVHLGRHPALDEGEGDDAEACHELRVHRLLFHHRGGPGLGAVVEAHGAVEGRDPGRPVHGNAVRLVVNLLGAEPAEGGRVDALREGSPEAPALGGVHALREPVELLIHHSRRHPVHVVEQGGDGELCVRGDAAHVELLLGGVGLADVDEGALEEGEAPLLESLLELRVVLALEVQRAARLRVLPGDVAVVEVVVLDHVGGQDALEDGLEVVCAVQAQLQLARRHASHECEAGVGDELVDEPAEDVDAALVLLAHVLEGCGVLLDGDSALDEPHPERRHDDAAHQVRKPARRARVEQRLHGLELPVPEALGAVGEVSTDAILVFLAEEVEVVLGKDLEVVIELEVHARDGLELAERNLSEVEVHRRDLRAQNQVVERVASRRGDGDDVVVLVVLDVGAAVGGQHRVVDAGVLPRDIVNVGGIIADDPEHGAVGDLVDDPVELFKRTHSESF
mmetsp:Transcript_12300/g.29013  ORF Transcript_12300/g.29013 Transcript_12300/m.29013 type:complete len:460 (+) Transcript_12300:1208-2587(+)